jgi:hypothetical protein
VLRTAWKDASRQEVQHLPSTERLARCNATDTSEESRKAGRLHHSSVPAFLSGIWAGGRRRRWITLNFFESLGHQAPIAVEMNEPSMNFHQLRQILIPTFGFILEIFTQLLWFEHGVPEEFRAGGRFVGTLLEHYT